MSFAGTTQQKLLQALPATERYSAAVLAVVCTLAIRLVFAPILADRAPFLFFLFTIVVVGRFWGRGPALLATFLGGLAAWYFIIEPQFSFVFANRLDALNLAAYYVIGTSISFLGGVSKRLPASLTLAGRRVKLRVIRQTVVLALAAVVLAGMVLLLEQDFSRTLEAERWVAHTYQVINAAESVRSTTENAESRQRSFLLTGEERYLAPYNAAVAALPRGLKELRDLTSDNPQQQERFAEVSRLTGERRRLLDDGIQLRGSRGPDAALAAVRSRRGDQAMDKLRAAIEAAVDAERVLLAKRTAAAKDRAARARWVLGLGSGALIFLLVLASLVIERETIRREGIAQTVRRHADLLEQAHDCLFTWPLGGAINYWSRGAESLLGYTREEALGRSSHELLQTSHPSLGIDQIDAMLERDGQWQGELTQTAKDGRKIIVEAQWTVARDADGNKTVLEANRDITARKRAEESLRESETQFRTLANAIPQLCWMANANGWIFWYNERWYQYTGTTPEQMEGWGWKSVHDPEALPKVLERWEESIATGKPFDMVFPLRGADGGFRPFLTRIMPVYDQEGKVARWFGTNTDISEQRRTEEETRRLIAAVQQERDKLSALLNSINDEVWFADREGTFILVNQAGLREFGYSSPNGVHVETLAKSLEVHRPDGTPRPTEEAPPLRALHGEVVKDQEEIVRIPSTGDLRHRQVSAAPVKDAAGNIIGSVSVVRDITENKRAEEELRESEAVLRSFFDSPGMMRGMIELVDGHIVHVSCNEAAAQLFGFDRKSMSGKTATQAGASDEVVRSWLALYEQARSTGKPVSGEYARLDAQGRERWLLATASYVGVGRSGNPRFAYTILDLTERKRSEEALRQSESQLRALGDNLPNGAIYRYRQDANGHAHVDFISAGIERLTGVPAAEFVADVATVYRNIVPEDLKLMNAAIALSRDQLTQFEVEVRHRHRVTGKIRWSLLRSTPFRCPDGSTVWDGIELDVTDHKREEAERELLATAIEQAEETIVITDREARIQYVNPAFTRTTGFSRSEAVGQNPKVLKSGKHDAKFYQELWTTLATGKLWRGEFTNQRKDGTLYMEDATIAPVRDASGEITNYIAIKSDITERRKGEIALRESEMMLRFFVRHAPAAIAMLDRDMRYLVVSQRWMSDYQLGQRELRGLSHYEVFPEVPGRWKAIHQRCLAGEVETCDEEAFPRLDGGVDWVRWEVRPWRKIDESIGGIIIFSEVITERKRAEQALQETELRYRQLFERSESALALHEMIFDEQGNPTDYRFLDINPAFEHSTGLSRSQTVGHRALEILPGLEEYWIKLYGRVATTGEPAVFENYASSLGRYYAGSAYSPRPNQFAVTFLDVTDRRRAEEEVRLLNVELEKRVRSRTAELEAANRELEAFAHSVSHDLRAPLRGIDGWSLALLEDYGPRLDEQGQKYLGRVRSEAQRMGMLIDDLLHLSRVGRAQLVPAHVDLSALAGSVIARLKEEQPQRSIEFTIEPNLSCTGDARLLEIALTNLLGNAVKFTAPRNPACVEFGKTECEDNLAFFVRDNGVGFDMAYAGMLFGTFQRLHKASEFPGTGVGLATVQRVIHRHGGRIWAEAQVGTGATFYFTLGGKKA